MAKLLCDTKGMPEKDWLKMRQHGPHWDNPHHPDYLPICIGGSTVGAIMGVSPWLTPLDIYMEKRGIEVPNENSEAKISGHIWEPYVAQMVNYMPGYENAEIIDDTGFYQHDYYPFAVANLDRRIINNGKEGILEIKTTSYHNTETIKKWKNGIVPIYYEYQIRWYMAIMDLPYADIICAWGMRPSDMHIIHVERDLDIENWIFDEVSKFVKCVETGEPPAMGDIDPELADECFRRLYGGDSTLPPVKFDNKMFLTLKGLREVVSEEQAIKDKYKEDMANIERRKLLFTNKILAELKNAETGYAEVGGETIKVTFKKVEQTRLDSAKVKALDPKLYEEASKKTSYRRLTVE